jgi:tRNA(fMet)-specific endonuclease VapC
VYLLDTDHISILQRPTDPEYSNLSQHLSHVPPNTVFTSIVSFHEQIAGWHGYLNKARKPAGVILAYRMLAQILADHAHAAVLPFDASASTNFHHLRSSGVRIETLDLRIASIALSREYTVLTRNTVDFAQVPGLRCADWTI